MKLETNRIKIREIQASDVDLIADYWLLSGPEHLVSMGVDLDKLPQRESLVESIVKQLNVKDEQKQSLAMIATLNNKPVGHCNVNQINFGEEATMHLHIWAAKNRKSGLGSEMVSKAIPVFFKRLHLDRLWCEPYSKNAAPNNTLLKIGFSYVKTHRTIPGSLNFEQEVNRYVFKKEDLAKL